MFVVHVFQINLCSASNYFGTLFYGIKGEMTEASNEHGAMIDEKFHECGMNKVCKYVVQNTNNGHYSTENEGKSLQKSKGDGTIWEKELKGMFNFSFIFSSSFIYAG